MRSSSANFVRAFLLVSGVLLASNALLNLAVDPYGVYGGYPAELFRDNPVDAGSRISKAELADRFTGTTAFVGSSRVEVAYDPLSPSIPDGPACNLGLSGTNFHELTCVLDFILQHGNFRRIVLVLDFQQFTDEQTVNYDFALSRFNPELSLFDYHGSLLLREDVTEASLTTLLYYFRGGSGEVTPLGFRRPVVMESKRKGPEVAQRRLLAALQQRDDLAAYRYGKAGIVGLRRFVQKCRAKWVELIVVIHPIHATLLATQRHVGVWDERKLWVSDVVRVVSEASKGKSVVWDFTSFGRYTTEPMLAAATSPAQHWFWEPSHCKAELGEQILRRIFHQPNADPAFGRQLTADCLEDHFAQLRAERETWMKTNVVESQLVLKILRDAGLTASLGDVPEIPSTPVDPGVSGARRAARPANLR